jgi:hypothetical protein
MYVISQDISGECDAYKVCPFNTMEIARESRRQRNLCGFGAGGEDVAIVNCQT